MICLVDADTILHRCCFGGGDFIQVIEGAEYYKDKIEQMGEARYFLSGPKNFRKVVDPSYKANRKKEKPPLFYELRDYMISEWGAEMSNWCEADDMIGINHVVGKTIIVSNDKDMQQLGGAIYDYTKDKMTEISKDSADFYFYKQMLMGDTVDNVVGVPKIGKVRATNLLMGKTVEEMEEIVVREYSRTLGLGHMAKNKLLLRILRSHEELNQLILKCSTKESVETLPN